jgi:hypothetical protein
MFNFLSGTRWHIRRAFRFQIPLKIHCWGGLGSQLFAVSLYYDLKKNFPNRNVSLVLHQGGVTKRASEIEGIFFDLQSAHVEDFSAIGVKEGDRLVAKSKTIRHHLKEILKSARVIMTLDDNEDLKSVMPWTYSVRGHYSYRFLGESSISNLFLNFTPQGKSRFQMNSGVELDIGVHYRLGDLVDLESKSPMDVYRLANACRTVLSNSFQSHVTLFSDSPDLALGSLKAFMSNISLTSSNLPTWETIGSLSRSRVFIGTFSKISIWVVIFRYYSPTKLVSYMPIESKPNLQLLLGDELDPSRVIFFN